MKIILVSVCFRTATMKIWKISRDKSHRSMIWTLVTLEMLLCHRGHHLSEWTLMTAVLHVLHRTHQQRQTLAAMLVWTILWMIHHQATVIIKDDHQTTISLTTSRTIDDHAVGHRLHVTHRWMEVNQEFQMMMMTIGLSDHLSHHTMETVLN